MKEFLDLCSEKCISWIFGLFFKNVHKWKPHHWNRQEPRNRCIIIHLTTDELLIFQNTVSRLFKHSKGTNGQTSMGHSNFIFQSEIYGHSLHWTTLKSHMDPVYDCQEFKISCYSFDGRQRWRFSKKLYAKFKCVI